LCIPWSDRAHTGGVGGSGVVPTRLNAQGHRRADARRRETEIVLIRCEIERNGDTVRAVTQVLGGRTGRIDRTTEGAGIICVAVCLGDVGGRGGAGSGYCPRHFCRKSCTQPVWIGGWVRRFADCHLQGHRRRFVVNVDACDADTALHRSRTTGRVGVRRRCGFRWGRNEQTGSRKHERPNRKL
jgi:hypothetical protein